MILSKRHVKKFAVLMAIINIYQADPDWDMDVKTEVDLYLEREAIRHKFPDGWEKLGSYDQAFDWYVNNFVKRQKP